VVTQILQLLLNGAMAGTILAVPAIGLTVIFAVLRFPNFAVASHATVGAFAGYVANVAFGLPVLPAIIVAFLVAGLTGLATDEFILKPFRATGFITTAIGSIALTIGLENVVRFPSATTCAATTCRSCATGASPACASARSRSRIL
jgi:branched-chain amino acid transport system permease protein